MAPSVDPHSNHDAGLATAERLADRSHLANHSPTRRELRNHQRIKTLGHLYFDMVSQPVRAIVRDLSV